MGTEPAFDVANIYEQADNDDAIVGSLGAIASVGAGGLGSVLEYRDLSAWRVSIPRLRTSSSSGKHCFVYEIDVQRIDIRAVSEMQKIYIGKYKGNILNFMRSNQS